MHVHLGYPSGGWLLRKMGRRYHNWLCLIVNHGGQSSTTPRPCLRHMKIPRSQYVSSWLIRKLDVPVYPRLSLVIMGREFTRARFPSIKHSNPDSSNSFITSALDLFPSSSSMTSEVDRGLNDHHKWRRRGTPTQRPNQPITIIRLFRCHWVFILRDLSGSFGYDNHRHRYPRYNKRFSRLGRYCLVRKRLSSDSNSAATKFRKTIQAIGHQENIPCLHHCFRRYIDSFHPSLTAKLRSRIHSVCSGTSFPRFYCWSSSCRLRSSWHSSGSTYDYHKYICSREMPFLSKCGH